MAHAHLGLLRLTPRRTGGKLRQAAFNLPLLGHTHPPENHQRSLPVLPGGHRITINHAARQPVPRPCLVIPGMQSTSEFDGLVEEVFGGDPITSSEQRARQVHPDNTGQLPFAELLREFQGQPMLVHRLVEPTVPGIEEADAVPVFGFGGAIANATIQRQSSTQHAFGRTISHQHAGMPDVVERNAYVPCRTGLQRGQKAAAVPPAPTFAAQSVPPKVA